MMRKVMIDGNVVFTGTADDEGGDFMRIVITIILVLLIKWLKGE